METSRRTAFNSKQIWMRKSMMEINTKRSVYNQNIKNKYKDNGCDRRWDIVRKVPWLDHARGKCPNSFRFETIPLRVVTNPMDKTDWFNPSKYCYQLSFGSSIERHAQQSKISWILFTLRFGHFLFSYSVLWFSLLYLFVPNGWDFSIGQSSIIK